MRRSGDKQNPDGRDCSQNTAVLLVDGKVQNPICNGDICVWEAEEDILYIHIY